MYKHNSKAAAGCIPLRVKVKQLRLDTFCFYRPPDLVWRQGGLSVLIEDTTV